MQRHRQAGQVPVGGGAARDGGGQGPERRGGGQGGLLRRGRRRRAAGGLSARDARQAAGRHLPVPRPRGGEGHAGGDGAPVRLPRGHGVPRVHLLRHEPRAWPGLLHGHHLRGRVRGRQQRRLHRRRRAVRQPRGHVQRQAHPRGRRLRGHRAHLRHPRGARARQARLHPVHADAGLRGEHRAGAAGGAHARVQRAVVQRGQGGVHVRAGAQHAEAAHLCARGGHPPGGDIRAGRAREGAREAQGPRGAQRGGRAAGAAARRAAREAGEDRGPPRRGAGQRGGVVSPQEARPRARWRAPHTRTRTPPSAVITPPRAPPAAGR
mmetsp:Transcript_22134/g.75203  ORF Transcript_22134/g.75203 Transcript_22134/m.75203 type:complete len:322 (+) Transcript_22134:887-1852(+)